MDYSVGKLSALSGVTTRTLRYYDSVGLLTPSRISNGYRLYSKDDVDRLQQILFFRELGFRLEEISDIIDKPDFDKCEALNNHLAALNERKERIEKLIENVKLTLKSEKGEKEMSDMEKFEGFKKGLIEENERKYGKELRNNFGDKVIDNSNERINQMSKGEWGRSQQLEAEIKATLKEALAENDPEGALAVRLCELHREWLGFFWGSDGYSKAAHASLAETYLADERFVAYYDEAGKGATKFLCEAIKHYCAE